MTLTPRTRDILVLALICFLCFFWRLGSVGLFDFNEGFYTQVAREMYLRGDYVTPRVNGILFFDKPPLALWLSALSFHLFGVNEFAARLPVALAATAIVALVYLFGSAMFGRRAGLLAGAMTALNPLFYATARQMTMDIHQTLWFAVAMFSFYLASRNRGAGSHRGDGEDIASPDSIQTTSRSRLSSILYLAFWASCGMGVLAKSVPGLFPIPAAFAYVVITERFKIRAILVRIREARVFSGVLLMLAITVPWFYLAWRANGRVFYDQFWILHHVQLAKGGDFNHAQPIWYYAPALLLGFFPWSLFLICAGVDAWRDRRAQPAVLTGSGGASAVDTDAGSAEERTATLFLLVWAVTVFVIFSAMKSKLVSYMLPMYPAAALLAGSWMARAAEGLTPRRQRMLKSTSVVGAVIGLAALGIGMAVARYILTSPYAARQRQDVPAAVIEFGVHALIVGAVVMSLSAALLLRGRGVQGIAAMVAGLCLFIAFADVEGLNAMDQKTNRPLQTLAREAGAMAEPTTPIAIYIGQPRRPSVFFYLPPSVFLGKKMPQVGDDGLVLERGEREPVDAFLRDNRPSYILTDAQRANGLLTTTPGITIVDRRDRWMLLRADANPKRLARVPTLPTAAQQAGAR